jgi:hypothetical protein
MTREHAVICLLLAVLGDVLRERAWEREAA